MTEPRFTAMRDATRDDYQVIGRHSLEFFSGLPDRVSYRRAQLQC